MKNKLLLFLLLAFIVGSLFPGCSSIKHYDDAIRIKQEAAGKYNYHPFSNKERDGNNLRGTVVKVEVSSIADSCFEGEPVSYLQKISVVFLDSHSKKDDEIEIIPIEDIILVGRVEPIQRNEYNNINVFENFNNPEEFDDLRAVPVDSTTIDNCTKKCDCETFDVALPGFAFKIECIKREFDWFFVELRGGYAVYTDKMADIPEYGREGWLGEIAMGVRFGGLKEWGIGLALSSGVPINNSFDNTDLLRPTVMLHGRYQSGNDRFLGMCMRPFMYCQVGASIDNMTMDLFNINMNDDCRNNIDADLPYIDFDLPISWGLGVGMDIPVLPFLDLSIDVGIRSIAFGESIDGVCGYDNVPIYRNLNMFLLRFGLTY